MKWKLEEPFGKSLGRARKATLLITFVAPETYGLVVLSMLVYTVPLYLHVALLSPGKECPESRIS